MEAGIANIIGANINSEASYIPNFANSGAVRVISRGDQYTGGGTNYRNVSSVATSSPTVWTWVYYGIDASHSSSIYGKSNTVTPLSLSGTFLIRY